MSDAVVIGGIPFKSADDPEVKRIAMSARKAHDAIERRSRKSADPIEHHANAVMHLTLHTAAALHDVNPEYRRAFIVQLINALCADQDELQGLADADAGRVN